MSRFVNIASVLAFCAVSVVSTRAGAEEISASNIEISIRSEESTNLFECFPLTITTSILSRSGRGLQVPSDIFERATFEVATEGDEFFEILPYARSVESDDKLITRIALRNHAPIRNQEIIIYDLYSKSFLAKGKGSFYLRQRLDPSTGSAPIYSNVIRFDVEALPTDELLPLTIVKRMFRSVLDREHEVPDSRLALESEQVVREANPESAYLKVFQQYLQYMEGLEGQWGDRSGEQAESRAEQEKIVDTWREDTSLLLELAEADLAAGHIESARTRLKEALRENPASFEAFKLLGEIEYREGNLEEAIPLLRNALALSGDSELRKLLSEARQELARAQGNL